MNAGLTNLGTLKAWLLPASQLSATDYDAQITAIGLGVAQRMQRHCNRLFERTVDDEFESPADCMHVVLPRYPLEAAPTIELRDDLATGFVAQTYNDLVVDHNLAAGLIKFGAWAGPSSSRLRFTYTGGYWWEQLESTDGGYPTSQPAGSTAVPSDLLLAWRLQCEHVWRVRDKLGTSIGAAPDTAAAIATLTLLPEVEVILGSYRRYP